jgi:hypothetical protein
MLFLNVHIFWNTTRLLIGVRYCYYPGRPEHGDSTKSPKDYYLVGDKLVYYCHRPSLSDHDQHRRRLHGDNVLECGADGTWSRPLPECIIAKQWSYAYHHRKLRALMVMLHIVLKVNTVSLPLCNIFNSVIHLYVDNSTNYRLKCFTNRWISFSISSRDSIGNS